MREPVIEVRQLHFSYGTYEAVRGVSFEVYAGELFALLGTNGAGKTTTMETLEGFRPPTGGAVRVLGMDPYRRRRQVHSRTGILLQESGFAGDLTVAETVRLWQAMSSRSAPVDDALEALGLGHRRDVRVKQLSGGERRRLDLVLATLGRPEVLFVDEPTSGLDPESRKAAWEVIGNLLAEGTTVLLTTHYLDEAERYAHQIAIMHEGRIAVSGNLVDVLSRERAQISFDLPAVPDGAALPDLVGDVDSARLAAGRLSVRTPDLQHDLATLVGWAGAHDVPLRRFRAQHACLEDVFHGVVDRGYDGRPDEVDAATARKDG